MNRERFVEQIKQWMQEMRHVASDNPASGACSVASAIDLWLWTFEHFGKPAADGSTDTFDPKSDVPTLADALGRLLAARSMVLNTRQLASASDENSDRSDSNALFTDLCRVQASRAAGEVGRMCAELVMGRQVHPIWDDECAGCIQAEEIDCLEAVMPGISYGARLTEDVLETDGSHSEKAGPCVRLDGLRGFIGRRDKLDGCLSGSRQANDRAAEALAALVM